MGDETPTLHCPAEVSEFVPESLAREHEFFPLDCSGGVLTVAVAAELSDEALDSMRFVLDREVREVIHLAEVIRRSLDALYGEPIEWRESIYYRVKLSDVRDDGTIVMGASGYTKYGWHWTGFAEIAPEDPDHGLWTWILSQEDRFGMVVSGEALDALREEYRRNA